MKAVLMSIQPKWCMKIARGEKTVEVRKTRPKIKTPFKVYIYMTAGDASYPVKIDGTPMICHNNSGRSVIGEFVCDAITGLKCDNAYQAAYNRHIHTCLTDDEIMQYANNGKLYYWHISNLIIYDKPKELGEFRKPIYCHRGIARENCLGCWDCEITRPPQSWCYVEELR